MRVAALAVGSELLGSDRVDSNSLYLAEVLERFGAFLTRKAIVGDREGEIADEIRRLAEVCDLLVVSGGLGPTEDDRTRSAAARAVGRELTRDAAVERRLAELFASMGRRMPEVNLRQAEVIEGCDVLENREGTAPGLRIGLGPTSIYLLPGVPREYRHLVDEYLVPHLRSQSPQEVQVRRVLRVSCLPESLVEERIRPVYETFEADRIAVLASPGDIRIRLSGPASSRDEVEKAARQIEELVGAAVFARDEEATLEGTVAEALARSGRTLATAESCTGGLLAQRLTSVAGSSAYFPGGVVCYSNAEKVRLLGISEATLARSGAVSEEVAREMAAAARTTFGTDFGVGITGIAGPSGGSEEKPVGSVHLALAGPEQDEVEHRALRLPGDRKRIRWYSSQIALEMVRRKLLSAGSDA